MNVRLKKTLTWSSYLVYQDDIAINNYTATVKLVTNTDDHEQQNIAYERMKFWSQNILADSVLIKDDNDRIEQWLATGAKVIALPDEPVDQIIGLLLFTKLNAVCENRLIITDVEIMSSCGDGMQYLHNFDECVGPFAAPGWWQDFRPVWSQNKKTSKNSKIVNLARAPDWKDLDLEWESKTDTSTSVVFADFNKDAKK